MGIRNFFNEGRGKKALKIISKICLSIIIATWGVIGVTYAVRSIQRNHFYPIRYKDIVIENALNNGLDPYLVFAVIKVESGFNNKAVSNRGAIGLMQLTPATASYMAGFTGDSVLDLTDASLNVKLGCKYISYLIMRFKSTKTALIAYNAGEGNVSSWLTKKEYSLDGINLDNIPFNETREYIKKIEKSFSKYKNLYGNIVDKDKNFE